MRRTLTRTTLAAGLVAAAGLATATPAAGAAESFGVTIEVVGDTQIQFSVCLTEGTALPARVTGTYTVTGGGASVSGSWWTTDPDVVLVGTEPCPSSMATVTVDGLQLATSYTVSASLVTEPVVEDDEGVFTTDPTRSAVSLSGTASTTTLDGSSAPGPYEPCDDDCDAGGSSGGGSSGGATSGEGSSGTSGSGTSGPGTSGSGTGSSGGTGTPGAGTGAVIANPQAFRPAQMDALTPAQLGSVPPASFGALPTTVFPAISPAQARALTPAQIATIGPIRARALTPSAVAALPPATIVALRPAAVANLSRRQVAALTSAQLRALTPAQVAALTPRQLESLTTAQRALLRGA